MVRPLVAVAAVLLVVLAGCPRPSPVPVPRPTPPSPSAAVPPPSQPPPSSQTPPPVTPEALTPMQSAQEACLSNLKRVALATMMYAQDYDERMPPDTRWTAAAVLYARDDSLLQCPSAPDLKVGYAYNKLLSFRALNSITDPQAMLSLGDSALGGANPATELTVARLARRHRGAGNAAYVDCHAKWQGVGP